MTPPRAGRCAVALALALSTRAAPARAGDHPPLRLDAPGDALITGAAVTFWVTTEALKPTLGPRYCRVCDRDAAGTSTLSSFDGGARDALRWSDTTLAARLSDGAAFLLTPAATIGVLAWAESNEESLRHGAEDALVIAEATSLAAVANQITKYTVARARPYAYAAAEAGAQPADDRDDNLSFFSGHATFAFAVATATATTASLRGFREAPWIWAGGLASATLAAYLRIAADKHYATDVLTGAAVGAAFGIGVPLLHRPLRFASPTLGGVRLLVMPHGNGALMMASGPWS